MYYFCTYFDSNYLVRGMTLYRSLVKHAGEFVLWVLCFDDAAYNTLESLSLKNLRPVALSTLEAADPQLLQAKTGRSVVEYYFTCSPSWPLYLLDRHPEIDVLTYLDADLCFYNAPEPIFRELGESSILIIEHRFSDHLRKLVMHGVYNVGLLCFKNDGAARDCLHWWRERCLEWCYDRVEPDRFADQKYLDQWPSRFQGVMVLQHKGAGLAPWNWASYRIQIENDRASVDGEPLVFYHFQGIRILNRWLFDPGLSPYGRTMPRPLEDWLYGGYLQDLRDTWHWLLSICPSCTPGYSTIRGNRIWRALVLSASLVRGRLRWWCFNPTERHLPIPLRARAVASGDDHPLLSIITPSFNQAPYIRQTIESVLRQDYPHVEHLVVDGGSTDGTVEILQEYGARYPDRFRWISERDNGQSDALNKGIALARGEIIGWQNSDDYYPPDVFAEPISYLGAHPDVAVVFSDCVLVDGAGKIIGRVPTGPFDYGRLLYYCCVPNPAAFVRKSALIDCGGVSNDLHYTMDYDLWLRLGLCQRMAYLPGVRGVWRQLPAAKTHSGLVRNRVECVLAVERAIANPMLPEHLTFHATIALQQHILEALMVALAHGDDSCGRDMLQKVLALDPQLRQWEFLCRRLLMKRVMTQGWYGEVGHELVRPVPDRALELLREAGLSRSSHARLMVVLAYLFRALDTPGLARLPRWIGPVLQAAFTDPHWIGYPAAGVAMLRLGCGDRLVDRLHPLFDALRARMDQRLSRRAADRAAPVAPLR